MKRNWLIYTILLFGIQTLFSQNNDFKLAHLNSIFQIEGFIANDINTFNKADLSEIISNKIEYEGDSRSSYSGVFGANFQRIDFHFQLQKQDSTSRTYNVIGKNRLGTNIRDLFGSMTITGVLKYKDKFYDLDLFLVIFDCSFYESGDKQSDGVFNGVYTTFIVLIDNEFEWFHSDSGDFCEYNSVFVGDWRKYDSAKIKTCIFSFDPVGLYDELPYCEKFYDPIESRGCEDNVSVGKKYLKYGWADYEETKTQKWW